MNRVIYLLALCALAFADDTTSRVKGGSTAAPGEFPYQVSLQLNNQHVCGGALVTTRHVVTSASCVVDLLRNPGRFSNVKVLVGTVNLSKDGILYHVSRVTLHPEYRWNQQWSSAENDIAVCHLSQHVQTSKFVQQINLPGITELPQNAELSFTGWGSLSSPNGPSSELLQKAKLRYINNQECQKYFAKRNLKLYQLCTAPDSYVGTCTTDQGGPLVYENQLVGISTGVHVCSQGYPDVFTKVSYYLKFIIDEINYKE